MYPSIWWIISDCRCLCLRALLSRLSLLLRSLFSCLLSCSWTSGGESWSSLDPAIITVYDFITMIYNYVTLCISIWCVHTNCWYTTDSARTAINRLLLADPCRPVSPSLILASHWFTVANTGCDWWRGQLPCKQSHISWYVRWRVRCERRVNYGDTGMVASHGPVKNYFSSSFIFT